MQPNDKVQVLDVYGKIKEDSKTNAEATLSLLTVEVLRDIARNEANSWAWRKAAVKILLDRQHSFADIDYLKELVLEIKAEKTAELEVQDIVETATEEVLKSEQERKIQELETEIERLKNLVPKFESSFKSIASEEVPKLLEE
jgi:uncharacterized membrane protein YccC